jgi:hypothetical protein
MKGLCVFYFLFIVFLDGCCCAHHATNNDQNAFLDGFKEKEAFGQS